MPNGWPRRLATLTALASSLLLAAGDATSLQAPLALFLLLTPSVSAQIAKNTGGAECVCPEAAAAEEEAGGAEEEPSSDSSDECPGGEKKAKNRDVQKLMISGAAGGFLALAVNGRRGERKAQVWTKSHDIAVQTYEEPRAPELPLPPVVQFVPPRPPQPARPPAPQLVYDEKPKPQMRDMSCQVKSVGVVTDVQTDWTGAPDVVQRASQTAPPAATFATGVQTLGIPHKDGFTQATAHAFSRGTQPLDPDDPGLAIASVPGKLLGAAYHPLLDDDRESRAQGAFWNGFLGEDESVSTGVQAGGNGSSSTRDAGTSAVGAGTSTRMSHGMTLTRARDTQTDGRELNQWSAAVQTDALIQRQAGVQTAPLHPPITQGSQTPGWLMRDFDR